MIKIVYYNQNNYSNIPYPSSSNKTATIKSGGCGVCCASMIVEGLTDNNFPPATSAKFSIANKARVNGGTDMRVMSNAIADKFGLGLSTTSDENTLLKHIKNGGMAIANVGGDRSGYTGVFSDGGHYIVVVGAVNDQVSIYDPGYYVGKFNKAGRKGKVWVDGNVCKCNISVLATDTANRSPAYYLFSAKKEIPKEEVKVATNQTVSDWAKKAQVWAKAKGISDGTSPKNTVTREEIWVMLMRFAESK